MTSNVFFRLIVFIMGIRTFILSSGAAALTSSRIRIVLCHIIRPARPLARIRAKETLLPAITFVSKRIMGQEATY
jgi:hypothetical protein